MIRPLVGIGGIASILVLAELLRATKVIANAEVSRKFVHILTGVFIATWPFFMSFRTIQALSVVLFAVVGLSKRLGIFNSVHNVDRRTYGEILFPAAIFLTASFAKTDWVFAAAILHLSLADGLAATVGARHSKRYKYKVLKQAKSLLGSMTFYVVSLLITVGVFALNIDSFSDSAPAILLWLPLTATLVESIGVYGTDNLLVPLVVMVFMNSVQAVA